MHDSCSGHEILISGNFPETAWRRPRGGSCQLCGFGVFLGATLGGRTLYCQATQMSDQILGLVLWSVWWWWISTRRRESVDSIFWFCAFWENSNRGKRWELV